MPLEGVFIETSSSNPAPDLSLHISPPTNTCSSSSSSSSICSISRNEGAAGAASNYANLNKSDSKYASVSAAASSALSLRKSNQKLQSYTELSLAHPANATGSVSGSAAGMDEDGRLLCSRNFAVGTDQEQLQSYFHNHHRHLGQQYHNNNNLNQINHGVSLLDVSDVLRPIKGIPVYHNRSFPFLPPSDQYSREKDSRMNLYQLPYPSWSSNPSLVPAPATVPSSSCSSSLCSSSSSSVSHHPSSPYFPGVLDPMSILNSGPNNTSSSAAVAYRIAAAARFNGLASDAFKSHHQLHHHHGVGPSEASHGMMRSRFIPKLPTKRSMRAPRMRWTSTLHARFVHAVELLGGHESKYFFSSHGSFFFFSIRFH